MSNNSKDPLSKKEIEEAIKTKLKSKEDLVIPQGKIKHPDLLSLYKGYLTENESISTSKEKLIDNLPFPDLLYEWEKVKLPMSETKGTPFKVTLSEDWGNHKDPIVLPSFISHNKLSLYLTTTHSLLGNLQPIRTLLESYLIYN